MRKKGKLLSLLLCIALIVTLTPATALAKETHPDGVNITIGSDSINIDPGKCLTKNEAKAENVKAYSAETDYVARYNNAGTLYLKGYDGGQITATGGSLNIVLEGNNTVTVNGSSGTSIHGIDGNELDLTIKGSGSLTVNATGTGNGDVHGILGKTVAIAESANVTINAKTTKTATYAIYAQNGVSTTDSSTMNLTVTGETGNQQALYGVYVNGGGISLGGSGAKSITMKGAGTWVYGIHTNTNGNTTTVSGGSLTVKNETSHEEPIAINAKGVVTLNAPVTIQNFKYGVYNNAEGLTGEDKADIKITGGTININSSKTDSVGLWSANNRVAISGGTVTINTKSSAIAAQNGGLDVTGSPTVTLTTEGSYASYVGAGTNTINLTLGGNVTATSEGTSLIVYPIQGAITLGENTKVIKGEQYSGGTVSGAENTAGSGTYTVKFEYQAPGAASAAVGDVTIEGITGTAITDATISVTLANDKFHAIAANADVKSWFTNLPTGLEAKIKTAVSENATSATITVSGTPTANSTAALGIRIPAANLTGSTNDLTVTGNANAKFDIVTLINEATATVTAPVEGQSPAMTATPGGSGEYTVTVTAWKVTNSGVVVNAENTFESGVNYAVEVKFEPAAGYKFADECTYKINGGDAKNGPTAAWVTLTASAAPRANISLKLVGTDGGDMNYWFDDGTPLTVTITNSGTAGTGELSIALDGAGKDAFTVSSNSIANVEKGGTADFTVTPKTGLAKGTYTATVKVSGTGVTEQSFTVNYESSGTATAIAVPTAITGIVYDGTEQTGVNPGTGYTLSGTYKATDAGTYTATAKLNDGCKWEDGTTDAKTITWNIGKRTPDAADFDFTPPDNLEYDGSEKTASITLKSSLTGAGTIRPAYMKDGSEVSSTKDAGIYTVKINVDGGSNFNAASGLFDDAWTFTVNPTTWGIPTEPLTVANPTTTGGSDGKITGTTTSMQYKKSTDSTWTDCTTAGVTGLDAGTYYVRYKADGNHNASDTNYQTLTLTDPGVTLYSVTVTDGTANPTGNQAAGTEVTITAATKTGFNFKEWSGLDDSVYKSGSTKTSSTATFIMPASAVNVTANYAPAALTGTVSISGNLKYGAELTATLADSNNTGNLDYKWYRNGTTLISTNNTGKYTLRAEDIGKTITVKITSGVQTGEITSDATVAVEKADGPAAPAAFTLTFTLNADGTTYTATIPTVAGGEYSFDGVNYFASNTKTDCAANTSCTGYVRIKETTTHKASAETSSTQTSPKLTVATPTFTPNGASNFTGTQSVTISCTTAGAKIYYTTDGTTPTTSSTHYTAPLSLTVTTTVRAIAVKEGMENSAVATAKFTKSSGSSGGGGGGFIPAAPVQKPEIKAASGGKTELGKDGTTLTITADAGKVIDKVLLNGKDMGAVTELKNLKTGDKVEVTFKDKVTEPTKAQLDKAVKDAVSELALTARSAKLKSGNIKVTLKGSLSEIEKNGYTVKYKFYRSTKKSKAYKAAVTKDVPNYLNTTGRKGTMYYYKARVMVYDKSGKLVASTALKQCKYANRLWTK